METASQHIADPISVINEIATTKPIDQVIPTVLDHFREFTQRPDILSQVPSIIETPFHTLPNHSLVRFRCMVQDSSLPGELFVAQHVGRARSGDDMEKTVWTLWRESVSSEEEVVVNSNYKPAFFDKQPLYCIQIPHESDWTKPLSASLEKLSLETREEVAKDVAIMEAKTPGKTSLVSAVVKCYDSTMDFGLNQCLEVVGVLEYDKDAKVDESLDETQSSLELEEQLPSGFSVPRIHALVISQLPKYAYPQDMINLSHTCDYETLQRELLAELTNIFLGDAFAAEYVLLAIFSRIHSHVAGALPIGRLPLNIFNVPASSPVIPAFLNFLKQLHYKVMYIPLEPNTLKKNLSGGSVETGVPGLKAGLLQVTDGTFMVIDETKLVSGVIKEREIRNLQSIQKFIQESRVAYHFDFQAIEIELDGPLIVFSEGKSMFQVEYAIPLRPVETDVAANSTFSEESKQGSRALVAKALTTLPRLAETVSSHIEQDFVAIRRAQKEQGEVNLWTQSDLFNCLNVTRCITLSYGRTDIEIGHWEKAKNLEAERKKRMAEYEQYLAEKKRPVGR